MSCLLLTILLCSLLFLLFFFFFFNDTATTEIYTLSLHDALPISPLPPGINVIPKVVKQNSASAHVFGSPVDVDPHCTHFIKHSTAETIVPTTGAFSITCCNTHHGARLASSQFQQLSWPQVSSAKTAPGCRKEPSANPPRFASK